MTFVLDASAVIALLRAEPGADAVEEMLEVASTPDLVVAYLSAVNLTEVLQNLGEVELPDLIGGPQPAVSTVPYDSEHARAAAAMLPVTRRVGLGLADRACLALAHAMSLPAVTTDRLWSEVDVGVEVIQLR